MTRNQRAVALLLLASLNAFGFMDRVVIGLIAQQVKAEFSLSDLEIGLLGGTVFAMVNTFAAVPVAMFAERFKRAHVAAVFLLVGSLFTALAGFTASFFQLMVCRLGMACGSAATEAPPHSMISDMYPPEKRASAISLFMLGVPVAALLGSFAGGAIAQSFGWRDTFLVFGLGGCAIALLCFAFLKEPERKARDTARAGTWAVARIMLGNPALIFITVGASFVSLGSFGVNTFLAPFFSREFGLGPRDAGLLFGLVSGVASFVGTLIGGYGAEWAARRDRRWLLAFPGLALVIGVPVFLIGLNSGSLLLGVPLMVIGCFSFYMAMGPCIATLHGSLDSFSRATGSALFLMVMHLIGQGLGPPLIGQFSDMYAAMLYSGGSFVADCAGAAGQVPGSACAQALATGLRYAICTSTAFFAFAALFLYLAARAAYRSGIDVSTPASHSA
ncbi:MAG: MFS transporter [Sphingobium sp.]|nr:MFS transporter [Sphingobium sp.]